MADFGNPVVVGGQFSVLSTDIFFAIVGAQYDQGRAASLPGSSRSSRWPCSRSSARCSAGRTTPPSAARATPASRWRCPPACAAPSTASRCHGSPSRCVVYLFAFAGGFVQTWGRDYTLHAEPFQDRVRARMGAVRHGLGRHRVELVLSPRSSWPASRRRSTAGLGLLIAWLLARNEFKGQGAVRVRGACWPSRFPARCSA